MDEKVDEKVDKVEGELTAELEVIFTETRTRSTTSRFQFISMSRF